MQLQTLTNPKVTLAVLTRHPHCAAEVGTDRSTPNSAAWHPVSTRAHAASDAAARPLGPRLGVARCDMVSSLCSGL
jgi:hypothetical protein